MFVMELGISTLHHQGASLLCTLITLVIMFPREVPWWSLLVLIAFTPIGVSGNLEGDALNAFRQNLIDSANVLQSWDPAIPNPCTWFHVTCNAENSVTRVDLGNSGLSGTLVPQLGVLTNLQYLELYSNNISGSIPEELGNLTALVSLDVYENNLTGTIPDSLGKLSNLRFLRLNNNSLTGSIPIALTTIQGLQVLDLSYNNLYGEVPNNGSFLPCTPISFIGNAKLCGSVLGVQCPGKPPFPPPPPYTAPPWAPSETSPPNQGSSNRMVIILASTIPAAILIFLILGFTFIICRNQKPSQDLQKKSILANVEGQRILRRFN